MVAVGGLVGDVDSDAGAAAGNASEAAVVSACIASERDKKSELIFAPSFFYPRKDLEQPNPYRIIWTVLRVR